MHTVSATRTIDSPVATVWNALDDVANVYRFHPMVESSESINDVTTGIGAKRQSTLYDGGVLLEQIVESDPEHRQVVNVIDAGPFPLEEAVATFDLKPIDENSTEVTMTMSFLPKYGPVGWLMSKLMMKSKLRAMCRDILAGLDTHLQTGEIVGQNGDPDMADASTAMAA
jgi:uncharacterized protein YndB with AHSA1/START domain